jgi:tripartite-type tricarboxylate transporter receptor subunit TctC
VARTAAAGQLPDVPTMSEFLPGYEASFWDGFGVAKGTPAEIIETLNREINTTLADPKWGRDLLISERGVAGLARRLRQTHQRRD